jgi:predicted GNAT superfamily acetyltransferase
VRPTPAAEIRLLTDRADIERLAALFGRIWGNDEGILTAEVMRAVAHSGGYVAAAVDETGEQIGGAAGWLGRHDGRPSLHSHVAGVAPGHEHAGVGRALKWHQWHWARHHKLAAITWTFDPLVRRNGWFNLQTLGVGVERYLVDFYGPLHDQINGADESDRLLAVWGVDDPRAFDAAAGRLSASTEPGDAQQLLTIDESDGIARPSPAAAPAAEVLLVAVPADIVEIRRRDHATAVAWRHAVRAAMTGALDQGWTITDMSTTGQYVLRRTR